MLLFLYLLKLNIFQPTTCLPSGKWERSNFLTLSCVWHGPPKEILLLWPTQLERLAYKPFIYPETCLGVFYGFLTLWLEFVYSCYYTAWLVSSVFGAYHPVSILGRRSLHLPGDQMAKVRNDCVHLSVISLLLVDGNMKLLYLSSLFAPQYWPSASETPSRWFCVALRKQRSSMSFQCRTL